MIGVHELRKLVDRVPRFPLAHLPTPLEHAPRFSQALGGPQTYIKRDDCTGLAFGGNKTRHNEFLIAEALRQEADMLVWGAGVQSNNCRQTAAACAKAGLDCHLVLGRGKPADGPDLVQGNLLVDHIVGAGYQIVDEMVGEELDVRIAETAESFRKQGRTVFSWDRHVVKPLAAVSYVLCLAEVVEQCEARGFVPDAVFVCSAGSTGAGLVLAKVALGCEFPVYNICPIRWPWDTQADMVRIANQAAEMIGVEPSVDNEHMLISHDFIGPGYGVASAECLKAIALLARTEGILLDTVYSGKAMAALIAHVRDGRFSPDQNVVFVHTGGTPALFAFHEEVAEGIAPRMLRPA